jgi:hypothetical protein
MGDGREVMGNEALARGAACRCGEMKAKDFGFIFIIMKL